jgi:hypothetical protein
MLYVARGGIKGKSIPNDSARLSALNQSSEVRWQEVGQTDINFNGGTIVFINLFAEPSGVMLPS